MYPGEILDARKDLLERIEERPGFKRALKSLIHHHTGDKNYRKQIKAAQESPDGHSLPPEMWKEIDRAAEGPIVAIEMALRTGECYRVTPDMCLMIEHLASELDDMERFLPKMAPRETGIVRFERPLPVKDIRGKTMLINWLVWGPVRLLHHVGTDGVFEYAETGTLLWHFNDRWTHPDEIDALFEQQYKDEDDLESWENYTKELGRWATVGLDVAYPEQRLGGREWQANDDQAKMVREEGFEPLAGTNAMRYVHAAWLLMNQTLPGVEEEKPDRPAMRRAKRMNLPSRVTVIRLRREQASDSWEPAPVEWQHKWVVGRHRRWQPYGHRVSDHEHVLGAIEVEDGDLVKYCQIPGCDHKRVWIAIEAYVKNRDTDLPFKQSQKLYSLER